MAKEKIDAAIALAIQIQSRTEGSWFTASGLARYTDLSKEETGERNFLNEVKLVKLRLDSLTPFGLIKRKITKSRKLMYKITLKNIPKLEKVKEQFKDDSSISENNS